MIESMERHWALVGMEILPIKSRPLTSTRTRGEVSTKQIPIDREFGEWTVKGLTVDWHLVTKSGKSNMRPYTPCECSCGVLREVESYRLTADGSKARSCGKPACAKKARDKARSAGAS